LTTDKLVIDHACDPTATVILENIHNCSYYGLQEDRGRHNHQNEQPEANNGQMCGDEESAPHLWRPFWRSSS